MLYLGLQISSWSSPCSFLHFSLKPISSSHHIKLFLTFDIDPRFVVSICLCICCSYLAISAFAIFILLTPAVLFKPCLGHHLFWKTCIKSRKELRCLSLWVHSSTHWLFYDTTYFWWNWESLFTWLSSLLTTWNQQP